MAKRIRKQTPRSRYHAHKGDAKRRGIPFLLTYEEWLCIWMESGRWPQRGPMRGQYVMARFGDAGAYEVDNVKICLSDENHAEQKPYVMLGKDNPNFGKNSWALMSVETQQKRAASQRIKMIEVAKRRQRSPVDGRFIH